MNVSTLKSNTGSQLSCGKNSKITTLFDSFWHSTTWEDYCKISTSLYRHLCLCGYCTSRALRNAMATRKKPKTKVKKKKKLCLRTSFLRIILREKKDLSTISTNKEGLYTLLHSLTTHWLSTKVFSPIFIYLDPNLTLTLNLLSLLLIDDFYLNIYWHYSLLKAV